MSNISRSNRLSYDAATGANTATSTVAILTKRPVMVVARSGGPLTMAGRRSAAASCHRAAEGLANHGGQNIRPVMPPVDEIARAIARDGTRFIRSPHEGRSTVTEVLKLQVTPRVVILASVGSVWPSGTHDQNPFIGWLHEQMCAVRPSVLAFDSAHQLFRNQSAGLLTFELCRELDIVASDSEAGPHAADPSVLAMARTLRRGLDPNWRPAA